MVCLRQHILPHSNIDKSISPDYFPGKQFILNLNFHIISALQKREIHVRKRRREPRKSHFYGPFELSVFAEETILNAGGRHNMHEIYQAKTDYSG